MASKSVLPEVLQSLQLKKALLILRALVHPFRQQILHLLHQNGSLPVTTIYIKLRCGQSVASQHLAILRRAGVVLTERQGKQVLYRVNYKRLEDVQELSRELLGHSTSKTAP